MSLSYKTRTARHSGGSSTVKGPFYVSDYGRYSTLTRPATPSPLLSVLIRFDDEWATERMDVVWSPEYVVSSTTARQYLPYLIDLSNGDLAAFKKQLASQSYRQALVTGAVPSPPPPPALETLPPWAVGKFFPKDCSEHVYRATVMQHLLYHRHRDLYRVYAALSPFHERSAAEIAALANERVLPDEGRLSEERVTKILHWFVERRFARVPECAPLPTVTAVTPVELRIPDYDHALGKHVRSELATPFALAPGTQLIDKAFVEKHRDQVRRSVHQYRQERTVEILRATRAQIADCIVGMRGARRTEVIKARGLSARRVLLEHEIVADVMRAHNLGVAKEASPVPSPAAVRRQDPVVGMLLPRQVSHIITTCSELPDAPTQPSPRRVADVPALETAVYCPSRSRMCNPWENYAFHEFSHCILDILANRGIGMPYAMWQQ